MQSFSVREHPLCKKAHEKFLAKGLPTVKDETFQYVPMAKLFADKQPTVLEEVRDHFDYILDFGKSDTMSFSNLSLDILPFPLARKKFGAHIDRQYANYIDKEDSCSLNLLNLSSTHEGYFLYVKKSSQSPIKIGLLATHKYQKCMIFVEKGVEATFEITMLGDAPRCHTWIDFTLQMGSSVQSHLMDDRKTQGVHLFHISASLKRDAKFEQGILATGGFLKRYHFEALIEGEGAHVGLKEFALGSGSSEIHLYSKVRHNAPSSTSNQLSKHLLFDQSKMSFTGKIYIDAVAQLSNAYQMSNHLLVSPFAIAHSKPGLEIFADDVKASHGATVSSIDEESLFYLLSRGLSLEEAKTSLLRSFPREILHHFGEDLEKKWNEHIAICQKI